MSIISAVMGFFEFIVNIFKFIGMMIAGLVNLLGTVMMIPNTLLQITVLIPPVLAVGVTSVISMAIVLKCISMFWGVGSVD